MAAAYTGVHLWAAAVKKANSFVHADVRAALPTVSVSSPMGQVTVSATNQHTVKSWYLGRVQASGQFAIVADTSAAQVNASALPAARLALVSRHLPASLLAGRCSVLVLLVLVLVVFEVALLHALALGHERLGALEAGQLVQYVAQAHAPDRHPTHSLPLPVHRLLTGATAYGQHITVNHGL